MKKALRLLLVFWLLGQGLMAQSVVVTPLDGFEPSVLPPVEENGEGEFSFAFSEITGLDIPLNNGQPVLRITLELEKIGLKDGDVSLITFQEIEGLGNILDFFTASYNSAEGELVFTQSVLFPANTGVTAVVPLEVLENSAIGVNDIVMSASVSSTNPNVNSEGEISERTSTSLCKRPILNTGELTCDSSSSTFSLFYFSDQPVSARTNDGTTVGDNSVAGVISGIPFGTNFNLIASTAGGCTTTIAINGLTQQQCDGTLNCEVPDLRVSQPICNGDFYEVIVNSSDGATLNVSSGNIVNGVWQIPEANASATITASNGACTVTMGVDRPINCNDPCGNPSVALGAAICDPNGSVYAVPFKTISNTTVSVEDTNGNAIAGVQIDTNNGRISNIPRGVDIIVKAQREGCNQEFVVTVPACPFCQTPLLTVGDLSCENGGTYSFIFQSNAQDIKVTNAVGNAVGNIDMANSEVTNIPLGENVIVEAATGIGCATTMKIDGLTNAQCDDSVDCEQPKLVVGQAICRENGYQAKITETTGATIAISQGTLVDGVITVDANTATTITATNGACQIQITLEAPINCEDTCLAAPISLGTAECDNNNELTYSVGFVARENTTVTVTDSSGNPINGTNIANGRISGIPRGVDVLVKAKTGDCEEAEVLVKACPNCSKPLLTVVDTKCSDTTYEIEYAADSDAEVVARRADGTIVGNYDLEGLISNIPFGLDVELEAEKEAGCKTIISVKGKTQAECENQSCVEPKLSSGQAICLDDNSDGYRVQVSVNMDATISVSNGSIDANTQVVTVPNLNEVTITATNGTCSDELTIQAPENCNEACLNPSISLTGTSCDADDSATYTVKFLVRNANDNNTIVTATALDGSAVAGIAIDKVAGTITNVPRGTDLKVTVSEAGCTASSVTVKSCPSCNAPPLTAGNLECGDGNTYIVHYNTTNGVTTIARDEAGNIVGDNSVQGRISDIPHGTNVTVQSFVESGCVSEINVTGFTAEDCDPSLECVKPKLSIGNSICNGTTGYKVQITENTGATLSATGGTIEDGILIVMGFGSATVTATNGQNCTVTLGAVAPKVDCTTVEDCEEPKISFGAASCDADNSNTYSVNLTKSDDNIQLSVTDVNGNAVDGIQVEATKISNIPRGTDIRVRGTLAGCDKVSEMDITACPSCQTPALAVGPLQCNKDGNGYNISFVSNTNNVVALDTNGQVVGTKENGVISGIPLGTNVIVTATKQAGCTVSTSVTGMTQAQCENTACFMPELSVAQAVCREGGGYDVLFSENTGATISFSNNGTRNGNLITVTDGNNLQITASNGDNCEVTIEVSPPLDCDQICSTSPIGVLNAICDADNSETYTVNFKLRDPQNSTVSVNAVSGILPNTVNVDASQGTITGIPRGTDIIVKVEVGDCEAVEINVPSCPTCNLPILTAGNLGCDIGGNTYNLKYTTDAEKVIAIDENGNKVGNTETQGTIKDIPFGTKVVVQAFNQNGCVSSIEFDGLTEVDCNNTDCDALKISAGQPRCENGNYVVQLTASAGASLSFDNANAQLNGMVLTVPLDQDVTITATAGSCTKTVSIKSPENCDVACLNPNISLGDAQCDSGNEFYSVAFSVANTTSVSVTDLNGNAIAGITQTATSIDNIPKGQGIRLTVTDPNCANTKEVEIIGCPSCSPSLLTVGELECALLGESYSIQYHTDGTNVVAKRADGSEVGDTSINGIISNIPLGVDVTIESSKNNGCVLSMDVKGLTAANCQDTCEKPNLSVGQAVCVDGNFYEVALSEITGATIEVPANGVLTDGILRMPVGTDALIKASNGDCTNEITVSSPENCADVCGNPPISISAASCDANEETYKILFTLASNAEVIVTDTENNPINGIVVGANSISNIPRGIDVRIKAQVAGCDAVTVDVDACQSCSDTTLSVGKAQCTEGNTYSISFLSNAAKVFARNNAGQIVGEAQDGIITNIPIGTDITVFAKNEIDCEMKIGVKGLTQEHCDANCDDGEFSVTNAVCIGNDMYAVKFSVSEGFEVSSVQGTINGNTITAPVGTDVVVVAQQGDCRFENTVFSPTAEVCADECKGPKLGNLFASCDADNALTYSVGFVAVPNLVIEVTDLEGNTIDGLRIDNAKGSINNIPRGTDIRIKGSLAGCANSTVIDVPSCPLCTTPTLTIGDISCAGDGTNYIIKYLSSATKVVAINGQGVEVGNTSVSGEISEIPLGTDIRLEAVLDTGCKTTIDATGPEAEDCDKTTCFEPNLSISQPLCDGDNYTLVITETTGAVLQASVGNIENNILVVPVGNDVIVTASNGDCTISLEATSPENCNSSCANAPITIGAASCDTDRDTYSVVFQMEIGTVISVTDTENNAIAGIQVNEANGTIRNIPRGMDIKVTAKKGDCNEITTIVKACPICTSPILSAGDLECELNSNTYRLTYITDAKYIKAINVANGEQVGELHRELSQIRGIPHGTNIELVASNQQGCETKLAVTGYTADRCKAVCESPDLSISSTLCRIDNGQVVGYEVLFDADAAAQITVDGGTRTGNKVVVDGNGSVSITATIGDCSTTMGTDAPDDCDVTNTCSDKPFALVLANCSDAGDGTYTIKFLSKANTTITVTDSSGNPIPNVPAPANGIIERIPSGMDIVVHATEQGCEPRRTPIKGKTCIASTIAIDDINNTLKNVAVSGNVLTNDRVGEGKSKMVQVPSGQQEIVITSDTGVQITLKSDGSYTYVPNRNFVGSDFFDYTVCDDSTPPLCDTARVFIEVIDIQDPNENDAPTANNDNLLTEENSPLTANILANDFDPEGDNLTIQETNLTTQQGVQVTLNADGSFTYTPETNFVGDDSFSYTICDTANPANCDSAMVFIKVIPNEGNITVANDDAYIGIGSNPITANVLDNDFDPEGNVQVVNTTLVVAASNGEVTIAANGAFSYQPNDGFAGSDSFVYEVIDDGNPIAMDQATVYLTVNMSSTIAVDDINNVFEGQVAIGNVLTNDIVAGSSKSVRIPSGGITSTNGVEIVINTNGNYEYKAGSDAGGTVDTFVYEVCDGADPANCDSATVTIKILHSTLEDNHAPIANADTANTYAGVAVGGNVMSNDFDPDGDAIQVTTITVTTSSGVDVNIDAATGKYTYTPKNGFIGKDSFSYTVCEVASGGLCDTAKVTITVIPSNGENKTFANDDAYFRLGNGDISGNVLDNDFDPEGDAQTVITAAVEVPLNGSLVLNADGSFVYTVNPSYVGADKFVYRVCDNGNPQACDLATVYLTIKMGTTVAIDDINSIFMDETATGNVLTNDVVAGDVKTVTTNSVTSAQGVAVSITEDGTYIYTPPTGYIGGDTFAYTVCDGSNPAVCDEAVVHIQVLPEPGDETNSPPIANTDTAKTLMDIAINGNVLSNDFDPDGDAIISKPVTNSNIASKQGAKIVLQENGNFSYEPVPGFIGQDTFEYILEDDANPKNTAKGLVVVTVFPLDRGNSTFANDDAYLTFAGKIVKENVLLNDFDPEGNTQTVNTTPVVAPQNGTLVLNNDGSFEYMPNPGSSGTDQFVYQVCDDGSEQACDQATVYLVADPTACELPTLSAGIVSCNGSTYEVGFVTNGSVSASAGSVDLENKRIINIPLGADVVITASQNGDCSTDITVKAPGSCPTECTMPKLFLGNPVCEGNNTYKVAISETTGAALTLSAGATLDASQKVITASVGTNISVTAKNGNCEVVMELNSPLDCSVTCTTPVISFSGTECAEVEGGNYIVNFVANINATVNADKGSLSFDNTTGIGSVIVPFDQGAVTIKASTEDCDEISTTIDACSDVPNQCPGLNLVISDPLCESLNGNIYSVSFSVTPGTTIIVTGGTYNENTNSITASLGNDIIINAELNGCEITRRVTSPQDCSDACLVKPLNVETVECTSTSTYSVNFTSSLPNATFLPSAGTLQGNSVVNIPNGTDLSILVQIPGCADKTVIVPNTLWGALDCDGDGVSNGKEIEDKTDPSDGCSYLKASQDITKVSEDWRALDCDGDGENNGDEVDNNTDPLNGCDNTDKELPPSDGENYDAWAALDCDGDGLNNGEEASGIDSADTAIEAKTTTDPYKPDTDGDGVTDGRESTDDTDPKDPCSFIKESQTLTPTADWNALDCDGDGVNNGDEIEDGTDPLDPCDSIGGTPPPGAACDIEIENGIVTPNNDGINDYIHINNIESFKNNKVEVFNRWGVKVFEAEGYDNNAVKFEGRSNARATLSADDLLPTGTYFYIITYQKKGEEVVLQGYLYINL
ncbi:MAG: Ig-like domain-containing protein [Flavobacteriaceae bacterium]|nr:Ig-like domain-containing protein [Flavobacteriaceae bacterium]